MMFFTATKDSEYGDCYWNMWRTEKRLIKATFKRYEKTGTYVFLKLFQKVDMEYEFQQRISLKEFDNLSKKAAKIRQAFPVNEM